MVIGSSNTDLLIKTDRIPDPGETVLGGTFMMNAGGKGANQAVAVARMGGDVIFVTRIGDDMFGRGSLAGYERDGIDVSHIIKDKAAPSGVALITVDAKGENCIVVAPGANNRLLPADIDAVADAIRHSEYLLMQMEIPVSFYSPLQIKMAVTGTGTADKHQIQEMVRLHLKLDKIPRPDHAADALADCICYIQYNSGDVRLRRS